MQIKIRVVPWKICRKKLKSQIFHQLQNLFHEKSVTLLGPICVFQKNTRIVNLWLWRIFLFWTHKANFARLVISSVVKLSGKLFLSLSLSVFSFQFILEDKHLRLTLEHVKNVWLIFLLTIKYIRVFKNTYPVNSCAALESCLRRRK